MGAKGERVVGLGGSLAKEESKDQDEKEELKGAFDEVVNGNAGDF